MKEIIREMLVLSKLESGIARDKSDLNLKNIILSALKENASWIEKKKLHG